MFCSLRKARLFCLFIGFMLGPAPLVAAEYYKCQGGVFTDKPWGHKGCVSSRTGKPYEVRVEPDARTSLGPQNLDSSGGFDSKAREALLNISRSVGLDVRKVIFADGRAKGGEKAMIITYIQKPGRESDKLEELAALFKIAHSVNDLAQPPSNSFLVTVGDASGNGIAAVGVSAQQVAAYGQDRDLWSFSRRWKVARFGSSFLPITSRKLGW